MSRFDGRRINPPNGPTRVSNPPLTEDEKAFIREREAEVHSPRRTKVRFFRQYGKDIAEQTVVKYRT